MSTSAGLNSAFLSYAISDRPAIEHVAAELSARGVSTFLDHRSIPAGSDWIEALHTSISESDVFLILLTEDSMTSPWVDRELIWAINERKLIVALRDQDANLSDRMAFLLNPRQIGQLPSKSRQDIARVVKEILGSISSGHEPIDVAPLAAAPAKPDPYTKLVTESSPAFFVILVDCSNSMSQKISGQELSKKQAVADTVNEFLANLLNLATHSHLGIRDLFHVAVLAYGTGTGRDVESLLGGDPRGWVSIRELDGTWEDPPPDDDSVFEWTPTWLRPLSNLKGHTVLGAALREARVLTARWIAAHPDGLPPIVLNLTDGHWTHEDPRDEMRRLEEQRTRLGHTVVFNCVLSGRGTGGEALLFPEDVEGMSKRTRELFYLSSELPPSMRREARRRGYPLAEDARGLVVNAQVSVVVDFLAIGSRTRV